MATITTDCASCGRSFFHVTTGGQYPKYCMECDIRIKRRQNRERVARHRKAAQLRDAYAQTPVQEAFKGAEHDLPRPDYSKAQEYIRSAEFAEHLEEIIAPLSEEVQMFWREKLRSSAGL